MLPPLQSTWFMKRKSCVTDLISFYAKITHLLDEGKVVGVFWDFVKALDTIPCSILLDNCKKSRYVVFLLKIGLKGRAQRVVVNGAPNGRSLLVFPKA